MYMQTYWDSSGCRYLCNYALHIYRRSHALHHFLYLVMCGEYTHTCRICALQKARTGRETKLLSTRNPEPTRPLLMIPSGFHQVMGTVAVLGRVSPYSFVRVLRGLSSAMRRERASALIPVWLLSARRLEFPYKGRCEWPTAQPCYLRFSSHPCNRPWQAVAAPRGLYSNAPAR